MLSATVTALIVLAAPPAATAVEWQLPDWGAVGSEIEGAVVLPEPADGPVACVATLSEQPAARMELTASPDDANRYEFRLPAPKHPGTAEIRLAWTAASGEEVNVERELTIANSVELEISGAAAEVLEFPLQGWPADVVFVPCCNIYGGILQMLRFPANPVGARGLPKGVVSDFIMARPDDVVRGTAGLNLIFDGAQDATVLRWSGERWEPALGVEIDEHGKLTLSCPNGGLFVLAHLDE